MWAQEVARTVSFPSSSSTTPSTHSTTCRACNTATLPPVLLNPPWWMPKPPFLMEGLQRRKQAMELPRAHPYTAFSDVLAESPNATGSGLKSPKNVSDAHIQPGEQHSEGASMLPHGKLFRLVPPPLFTASGSHGESRKPKADVDERSPSLLTRQALPAGWAEAARLRRS